jgi:hypothetical protein
VSEGICLAGMKCRDALIARSEGSAHRVAGKGVLTLSDAAAERELALPFRSSRQGAFQQVRSRI